MSVRGRLDGTIGIRRDSGSVTLTGEARLLDGEATGPALGGDRIAVDSLGGTWDLAQTPSGLTVRRLDLACPVGSVRTRGAIPALPGSPGSIEARIDLAAVSRQAPRALRLREGLSLKTGTARVRIDVREEAGAQRLEVVADLADLVANDPGRAGPIAVRDPFRLTAGVVARDGGARVEKLGIRSSWLAAEGSGSLDEGVHVVATVDLAGLEREFHDLVDFQGVRLAGKGRFEADYRRDAAGFSAKLGGDIQGAAVGGLTAEPFRREFARIQAGARGPIAPNGLPMRWSGATVAVTLPDASVAASATQTTAGMALSAVGSLPVFYGDRSGRADARLWGSWDGSILDVAQFRGKLTTADPGASLSLAAKGRFDTTKGAVALEPLPNLTGDSLKIAAGGLRIGGLFGAFPLTIDGGIDADLGILDRAQAAWLGGTAKGLDGPSGVAIQATYDRKADRVALAALGVATRYGNAGLSGTIAEWSGRRIADLQGPIAVYPATIDAFVASNVSADARVEATARPIRLRGPLAGDLLREIEADGGLDLVRADASGLRLGPAPVVFHMARGRVAFEPIVGTLNGGRVDLRPDLSLVDEAGATLRLLPGSAVRGATIDDEVSRRLLSYAAPILNEATEVRGKVSAVLDRAEFPIGGEASRQVTLAGEVQFEDVRFGPGPAAREILDLATNGRQPEVVLNETVKVAMSDRKVYQKGLTIPVGRGASLSVDGAVGLDKTLDLWVQVPLGSALAAKGLGLAADQAIGPNEKLTMRVGGTLSKPKIDRQALARALKDEGRSALRREAGSQAAELLKRLAAPEERRRK